VTTAISCPDTDRLREFVQDQLPPEEAEPIRKHLDECEACRAAVEQLSDEPASAGNQTMVAVETPPPQDATRIRPEGGGPSTPGSSPARSRLPYLAPPERDDELGRLAHYRVLKYRILKVLGEGGMGVVFKAEDLHLERVVALKVMKPRADMEDDFEQRFLREARATAALRSDHIVTIFEVNKDRNVFFLAMEFLQGESLENWLARGQRPSVTHTIRIAREIALGLATAHAKGLIHRDIKPANIWLEQFPVTQPGAPPYRVKILDFGLARKHNDDQHLTQAGYIVGTPAYMAPEQAHGEEVDQRCDLFSLGCVLYHRCGGRGRSPG
jgi:serine/threonine protein kinase